MSLAGKTALITGGSRGIGFAIAQAYVAAGAHVLTCARHVSNMFQTFGIQAWQGDVSLPWDREKLMEWIGDHPIDVLVNNAGVAGRQGPIESVSRAAVVETMLVNVDASVELIRLVLPQMKARKAGCIVQLSGGGVTKPFPNRTAYAASKAAIVAACACIAEEVKEYGITVNCLAPGSIKTDMNPDGTDSIDKAAACAVFLGDSPPFTGKLISAQWDDWNHLPANMNDSDLYTLRRVTGICKCTCHREGNLCLECCEGGYR